MNMEFITIAPGAWGKGKTTEEALKKCRSIYGTGMKDYDTYAVHPETYVDADGAFCWPSGESTDAEEQITTYKPKLLQRVRKGKIQKLDA